MCKRNYNTDKRQNTSITGIKHREMKIYIYIYIHTCVCNKILRIISGNDSAYKINQLSLLYVKS